jgi:preprotein translocase subunit SecE
MNKIFTYFENAWDELIHKVTWPTWKELQETTAVVLTTIGIITLIVFVMDGAAEFLFKNVIYKIFS